MRNLFSLLMVMAMGTASHAQDIQANQPLTTAYLANPAFAGTSMNPRLTLLGRMERPSVARGQYLYSLSYDQQAEKINSGIGIYALQRGDHHGAIQDRRIACAYNYEISLGDNFFFRPGIEVAAQSFTINKTKLSEAYNLTYTPGISQGNHGSITAGVLGYYHGLYTAASLKNIGKRPKIPGELQDNTLSEVFSAQAGYFINVCEQRQGMLHPFASFQYEDRCERLLAGVNYSFCNLTTGVSYQFGDYYNSLNFLAGYQKGIFKAGYTYGHMKQYHYAGQHANHQLSLTLQCNKPSVELSKPAKNFSRSF